MVFTTIAVRGFNYVLSLLGIMALATSDAQAGLSGELETAIEMNNSQFYSESSLQERLDLVYNDHNKGLISGLSLALSQQTDDSEAELYQFYLQQDFNKSLDRISVGRFFRADTLGYYSLDGLQYRHKADALILNFYTGVPGRVEAFNSIDGEAIYGVDLLTMPRLIHNYQVDTRFGWQRLDQDGHEQRYHFGLAASSDNENLLPAALSMSASYVVERSQWESVLMNTRWDLKEDSTLRLDYETYEPADDALSFRDRFYSLYATGQQTQFKAAYQFKYDYQQTWSVATRQVNREVGGNGYASMFEIERRSNQGLLLAAKAEQLELQTERVSSLFIDVEKTLSSSVRGGVSSVLQQQEKQLEGDNRSIGIELRMEHMLGVKDMLSGLEFDVTASHIWNSRLEDEYRFLLSLSYSFGDDRQGAM